MKLILSLLLILTVLTVGVIQAEAYEMFEGEIRLDTIQDDSNISSVYQYEGTVSMYELEPQVYSTPSGNMQIKLLDEEGTVLDSFTTPINPTPIIDPKGGDGRWSEPS
ncbi:MAG: hypothetical protein KC444_07880 [Nitrosopumilus sp.]|nr:hypothetical protein [Nitrosopumilus sp.]